MDSRAKPLPWQEGLSDDLFAVSETVQLMKHDETVQSSVQALWSCHHLGSGGLCKACRFGSASADHWQTRIHRNLSRAIVYMTYIYVKQSVLGFVAITDCKTIQTSNPAKVDAVYYNNLVALSGAVSHSGDEVTGQASTILSSAMGEGDGRWTFAEWEPAQRWGDFDEMVWAVFAKLPSQVLSQAEPGWLVKKSWNCCYSLADLQFWKERDVRTWVLVISASLGGLGHAYCVPGAIFRLSG